MCHRRLKFVRHATCGHNAFQGEAFIDCQAVDCHISTQHPPNCGSPSKPCQCRRYYSQPERLITHQVPGVCPMCPQ